MYGTSIEDCPRFDPDKFREIRKARRLSRRQLGELINRSGQTIVRWENGSTPPPARALREAAHVMRVRPSELLRPTAGDPTLADLRMDRALTTEELAVRGAINVERLHFWELTGRLGAADETPLLLGAFLGIRPSSVERYLLTGQVPEAITFRLSRVLHVQPEEVQAGFDRTAELYAEVCAAGLRCAS